VGTHGCTQPMIVPGVDCGSLADLVWIFGLLGRIGADFCHGLVRLINSCAVSQNLLIWVGADTQL